MTNDIKLLPAKNLLLDELKCVPNTKKTRKRRKRNKNVTADQNPLEEEKRKKEMTNPPLHSFGEFVSPQESHKGKSFLSIFCFVLSVL